MEATAFELQYGTCGFCTIYVLKIPWIRDVSSFFSLIRNSSWRWSYLKDLSLLCIVAILSLWSCMASRWLILKRSYSYFLWYLQHILVAFGNYYSYHVNEFNNGNIMLHFLDVYSNTNTLLNIVNYRWMRTYFAAISRWKLKNFWTMIFFS